MRRDDATRPVNRDVAGYTPAEEEFIRAVAAYQKRTGIRFLAATEYLEVAIRLGYRKPDGPPTGETQ